ncbi:hypothetical protein [Amycolatopsis sp. DG1A-15b]|uniref:hypothetical protein n=1 Tax=Amycolatopsis sp. DG1A-15b TaxID=3052846 RepID=UPI00255BF851|nr:hypothetical protein [Amycolatopsis sp. DG1A-15b]WIX92716.1 hypothetical protein QRY02_20635 [Amycolatopsis sp. DG1A-15b]
MHTRGVLIALLVTPVAAVLTFVSAASCVLALYGLTNVLQSRTLPGEVTARIIPRWSARAWWSTWRSKGRRKNCAAALLGAASRIAAAAFVWYLGTASVVAVGWEVGRLNGEKIPDPTVGGPPLIAFLGAVWGGAFLLHAVRYMTSGKAQKFWTSPELTFLADRVGAVNRFDFLRKVWLYTWLRWSAKAGMYLGLVITLSRLSGPSEPISAPRANPPRFAVEGGYGVLFLVGVALTFAVGGLLRQAIAIALPTAHAAVAVERFLAAENREGRSERTKRRAGIIDRLGKRRVLLARAARAMNASAARIDLAFGQHPVASILRACGGRLQAFLAGTRSLTGACPEEVNILLKDVVAVLAGPADPRLPAAVAQAVGAFDQDGVPVQHAAPKRHWISLAARTADAVDRYSRLAASLWLLCYFAVAITLLLLGSLSLTKLPLQK